QSPEGVEVRVHAHECLDQTLHLLGHPADLLPADGLEGPAEALVEGEQIRDVPHAALAEPAHQLAVVAHQPLGLATDVGPPTASAPSTGRATTASRCASRRSHPRWAAAGRWCWTTSTAARRCAASCCPSAGRT